MSTLAGAGTAAFALAVFIATFSSDFIKIQSLKSMSLPCIRMSVIGIGEPVMSTTSSLDHAGRKHFLSEMVFVFGDSTIPFPDRPVLAYDDIFCNLI